MPARVAISIPGKPRGKARPRAGQGNIYPDRKAEAEEAYIRGLGSKAMRGYPPFTGPVKVAIEAVFDIPASWPPAAHAQSILPHVSKPDLDNIEKIVLDALNGVVFEDDSQIFELIGRKRYGEGQRVDVVIEEVETFDYHPAVKRSIARATAIREGEREVSTVAKRRAQRRRKIKPAVKDEPVGKRLK